MGKLRNLDKEYKDVTLLYQQQKEYRKTDEGRFALKKANKKYKDSIRIEEVKSHPEKSRCSCCNENILEFLSVRKSDNKIVCYNCKFQLHCPHQEELKNAI